MKLEIEISDAAFEKLIKLSEISRGHHTPETRAGLLLSRAITADHRIHFDARRIERRKAIKLAKLRARVAELEGRPIARVSEVTITQYTTQIPEPPAPPAPPDPDMLAAVEEVTADVPAPKKRGVLPPGKPKGKPKGKAKAA